MDGIDRGTDAPEETGAEAGAAAEADGGAGNPAGAEAGQTVNRHKYERDVSELKKAKPYLFASEDHSGSTGSAKKGDSNPEGERTRRMRETMGMKDDGK